MRAGVSVHDLPKLFSLDCWTAAKIDFHLMSEQALTGIGFNKEKAEALVALVDKRMEEIADEVHPLLPPRPMNKGELDYWTLPAKPFKKDGSLSATMLRWAESRGGVIRGPEPEAKGGANTVSGEDGRAVIVKGIPYPIKGNTPTKTTATMTLANQDDLKTWLVEEKQWKPTLWNVKRDSRGKPERDSRGKLILTTPKMQENGKLCPNLEELQGDVCKLVVEWLSLRNRRSVVEGWLSNPRLEYDGRLSAGAAGYTSTFRKRHSTCVNIPKAEDGVRLGKEMRDLFYTARPGYKFVGWDVAALENRVEAHYCLPMEGGKEHAAEILEGDPHTKNAFIFYPVELSEMGFSMEQPDLKEVPRFKPFRTRTKAGRYLLSYGGKGKRLAATLGKPESEGDLLVEDFWDGNPALKALRDKITDFWETTGGKQWIPGIDGRRVRTRSKHSLVNTLFQSCGAIIVAYSFTFLDKWLGGLTLDAEGYPCYLWRGRYIYRVVEMHDEGAAEVPEELAEDFKKLAIKSIERAGQHLKMRVALTGEAKVGDSWRDVH